MNNNTTKQQKRENKEKRERERFRAFLEISFFFKQGTGEFFKKRERERKKRDFLERERQERERETPEPPLSLPPLLSTMQKKKEKIQRKKKELGASERASERPEVRVVETFSPSSRISKDA